MQTLHEKDSDQSAVGRVGVIFSGGVDSTTLLGLRRLQTPIVHAFSFDDGTEFFNTKERPSIQMVLFDFAEKGWFIKHEYIRMFDDTNIEDPNGATTVPGWKMGMLVAACAYADRRKLQYLEMGYIKGDANYPDDSFEASSSVIEAYNKIYKTNIKLRFPFADFTKSDVIELAREHNIPLQHTLSCSKLSLERHCRYFCKGCLEREKLGLPL